MIIKQFAFLEYYFLRNLTKTQSIKKTTLFRFFRCCWSVDIRVVAGPAAVADDDDAVIITIIIFILTKIFI